MNPTILVVIGPGFLNQVPTLGNNIRQYVSTVHKSHYVNEGFRPHDRCWERGGINHPNRGLGHK